MFKKVILFTSFFSFVQAMEQHLIAFQGNDEHAVNRREEDLVRAYEAHEMRWLPDMYEASGLSCQMSKPFFCVNALAKMKELMENARCCPGLQDCMEEMPDGSVECCGFSLLAIEGFGSFMALVMTLVHAVNAPNGPNKPWKFPEGRVQTSCMIAELLFNYTAGSEWAHDCIIQSMKIDQPCNVTASREAFNKNGGGYFYDASACCYDKADPVCYQEGLRYNKEVYPKLHSQEVWNAWKPFMIAAPTVVALNLGILAGYRLRRYLRERARAPFRVAATQPLLIDAEEEV